MADETGENLTVVDVYDAAAVIGKDFENLIDNYGADAVTELMPKVIKILEHLEYFASRNEKENTDVAELKLVVERLESSKADKVLEREKYEKELEQIEDTWRQEVKELLTVVAKLQEDNRKLNNTVREKDGRVAKIEKNEEEETRVLTRLKNTVDQQRGQIKGLEKKLRQQTVDMEAMQLQLEKIARQNVEVRRQSILAKSQTQQLLVDKADLETQIQECEQQIAQISETIEQEDKAADLHVEPSPYPTDDMENIEKTLHNLGKMVVDLKDPNRPRFTMTELREVLLERNELKTKLIEVEEELKVYKPKSDTEKAAEEDCLPVHGPINREPIDKLYPGYKEESGIKRFFKTIFGVSNKPKGELKTNHHGSISRTVKGDNVKLNTLPSNIGDLAAPSWEESSGSVQFDPS